MTTFRFDGRAAALAVLLIAAAGSARAEWRFDTLGWEDDEARDTRVARFVWQGEGGDLDAFPFAEACSRIARFLDRLGPLDAPREGTLVISAEVVQGTRLSITRRVARRFEVTGGVCVGTGDGVDL